MKKSLLVVLVLFAFSVQAAETQKVCVKDEKTKKEVCKTIKVHKKLEGTSIPTKK